MSLFDHKHSDTDQNRNADFQGFPHPIDDAKKLMAEVATIVRDIRKMVDKAARAMKILGEP